MSLLTSHRPRGLRFLVGATLVAIATIAYVLVFRPVDLGRIGAPTVLIGDPAGYASEPMGSASAATR